MRLAWATDIHLNFLRGEGVASFCRTIAAASPDALLLSGDLAEADSLERHLRTLEERLARPIYFVLGNHDFYRGSIEEVRETMARLTRSSSRLGWLPATGVVALTPETGLLGHDGWADGRLGDFAISPDLLTDYFIIRELSGLDSSTRLSRLHALGDQAAAYVREMLPRALARFPTVLFVTHVPPFREACWHEGRISDDEWLPHFTCKAVGEALVEIMCEHPHRHLTVLCGHTHGEGYVRVLPNLEVHTGGAEYGAPAVQRVWDVG
jgi:3',5'-cyclic AMP phosphodiesterase CpdA